MLYECFMLYGKTIKKWLNKYITKNWPRHGGGGQGKSIRVNRGSKIGKMSWHRLSLIKMKIDNTLGKILHVLSLISAKMFVSPNLAFFFFFKNCCFLKFARFIFCFWLTLQNFFAVFQKSLFSQVLFFCFWFTLQKFLLPEKNISSLEILDLNSH